MYGVMLNQLNHPAALEYTFKYLHEYVVYTNVQHFTHEKNSGQRNDVSVSGGFDI